MKKVKLVLVICLGFLLVGCSKVKDKITEEKFLSVMNNNNYSVVDNSKEYEIYDFDYSFSQGTTKLRFVDGTHQKDIEALFLDECQNALNEAKKESKHISRSGDNWADLIIEDEENYFYLCWIDDTYISIKTSIANKTTIKKLLKELGY